MTLCEPHTTLVLHERAVVIRRGIVSESFEEQELSERAAEKVSAPHDLGDAHECVIDNARELVAWEVVFSPYQDVTEFMSRCGFLRPEIPVGETNLAAMGNSESPIHSGAGDVCVCVPACAGIRRLFVARMRCGKRGGDFFARASAREDVPAGAKLLEG